MKWFTFLHFLYGELIVHVWFYQKIVHFIIDIYYHKLLCLRHSSPLISILGKKKISIKLIIWFWSRQNVRKITISHLFTDVITKEKFLVVNHEKNTKQISNELKTKCKPINVFYRTWHNFEKRDCEMLSPISKLFASSLIVLS
jgi:hypothetical protein